MERWVALDPDVLQRIVDESVADRWVVRLVCRRFREAVTQPCYIRTSDATRSLERLEVALNQSRVPAHVGVSFWCVAEAFYAAVRGGHIDTIDWVCRTFTREKRHWWNNALRCAARAGQIRTLEWLIARHPDESRVGRVPYLFSSAARGGQIGTLEWLVAQGQRAAANDHETCFEAAEGGQLAALEWAYEHGFPLHTQRCEIAARSQSHRLRATGASTKSHDAVCCWLQDKYGPNLQQI